MRNKVALTDENQLQEVQSQEFHLHWNRRKSLWNDVTACVCVCVIQKPTLWSDGTESQEGSTGIYLSGEAWTRRHRGGSSTELQEETEAGGTGGKRCCIFLKN